MVEGRAGGRDGCRDMQRTRDVVVVLITAPDLETARKLARGALEARLVACVNLVPGVESHYWWEGRMEQGQEVLMICKTVQTQLTLLEGWIRREHPYQVPEFLVLPVQGGFEGYLDWVKAECVGEAGGIAPGGSTGRA